MKNIEYCRVQTRYLNCNPSKHFFVIFWYNFITSHYANLQTMLRTSIHSAIGVIYL